MVEESFEAAAQATRERMAKLTPEQRLHIHSLLLGLIYPDGLDSRIQGTVAVIQR